MTTAKAKRHDLYNALTEFIGVNHTDTLMTYLPSQDGKDLATWSDFRHLSDRVGDVHENLASRFEAINQRLDRLVLRLVGGLIAILATLIAQTFIYADG
jgi:hypothetical protein